MSTEMTVAQKTPIAALPKGGLQLVNMDDMWRFANAVVASGLAPKDINTPEKALISIQFGMELGLAPMQSLQSIAVVNGRPTVWGDAVPGLVRGSGLLEMYQEEEVGTPFNDDYGWRITSLRKGDPKPVITTFTVADAKRAGLWGKTGPWTQYQSRMLKNRSRTFNFRDNFPDVLKGLRTYEEARDMVDVEAEVISSKPVSRVDALADMIAAPVEGPEEVVSDAAKEPELTMEPSAENKSRKHTDSDGLFASDMPE